MELDKNLIVNAEVTESDVVFYDVFEPPFDRYGFCEPEKESDRFRRLPESLAEQVSPAVLQLSSESTGCRVRFSTDSSYIAIRVEMPRVARNVHTPLEASAGFDLYEDFPTFGESRFVKTLPPPYELIGGYEQIKKFDGRKKRYFTLNLPIRSTISNLEIGIESGATLEGGAKYRGKYPIVVYGSSIVQGTASVRPGMTYTNVLSRRLNMDVVNLGFAGNAKAEEILVDYMSGLDMCIFVCDYDHNAPSTEHLRNTHLAMYQRIREDHPDLPYVVISRPNGLGSVAERRDVIIDTFRYGIAHGDKNIYYIDGQSFFLSDGESDLTADGTHPNDAGFLKMVDSIECVIREIMSRTDCLN